MSQPSQPSPGLPSPAPTPTRGSPPSAEAPLASTFAGDADMAELIEYFVTEVGHRIEDLQAAWRSRDLLRLRTLAHQMKGAAGGYGYPAISDVAAILEDMADRAPDQAEAIESHLDQLVELCRRATRV